MVGKGMGKIRLNVIQDDVIFNAILICVMDAAEKKSAVAHLVMRSVEPGCGWWAWKYGTNTALCKIPTVGTKYHTEVYVRYLIHGREQEVL
jgi:hypothetical protein